jgi:hypothetical protein
MKKLHIFKPMPHISKFDCCFRELLDLWYERGFCDRQYITAIETTGYTDSTLIKESRVWINEIDDVLCYDSTRLDKYFQNYRFALCANEVHHSSNASSWIFWPRWPRQYEILTNDWGGLSWHEREHESVFIGNQTTGRRGIEWKNVVSLWHMGDAFRHQENSMTYSYPNYLRAIGSAKYGLLLPGQGPKCLRDIELMGLGTVPIVTDRACLDYFHPWTEGEHYLFAASPEEMKEKMASVTRHQWYDMSFACLDWYGKNCAVLGSYKTTLEILEKAGVV